MKWRYGLLVAGCASVLLWVLVLILAARLLGMIWP